MFHQPYVSHVIGDHTSMLALIEKRFLSSGGITKHLTLRDQYAHPLEDMFDFANAPSLNTVLTQAAPPVIDCTPAKLPIGPALPEPLSRRRQAQPRLPAASTRLPKTRWYWLL